MDSRSQFYALEVMCHERAAVARKEMEYWLNEAQEWAQLRKAAPASMPVCTENPIRIVDVTESPKLAE
jgi:hypothetical protein